MRRDLQAAEWRPETEVRTESERDVLLRVLTVGLEPCRVRELALVTVARGEDDEDRGPCRDGDSGDRGVRTCHALLPLDRRFDSKRLLEDPRDEAEITTPPIRARLGSTA